MWERSFVVMHVLAGGELEDALASLDAAPHELARALSDPKRTVRAKALAAGAEEILRAVQETTFR